MWDDTPIDGSPLRYNGTTLANLEAAKGQLSLETYLLATDQLIHTIEQAIWPRARHHGHINAITIRVLKDVSFNHAFLADWRFPSGTIFELTKADLLALGETTLRHHPEIAEEYVKLIEAFQNSIDYALLHQFMGRHFPVQHHHFECSSFHCQPKLKDPSAALDLARLKLGADSHFHLRDILTRSIHTLFYICAKGLPGSRDAVEKYTDFIKDMCTNDSSAYGYFQRALLMHEARVPLVREIQFAYLLGGLRPDPVWEEVLDLLKARDSAPGNVDGWWCFFPLTSMH
jgi:hypothetical protein